MKTSKLAIVAALLACAAALAADPQTTLPGSRWTLERAVQTGPRMAPGQFAYAAVCEAMEKPRVMVGNMTDQATQKFKVISVLGGAAPEGEVMVSYAVIAPNERAIPKGQRVIWVFREVTDRGTGAVKAVADTDADRQAVLAALQAAGIATATAPASQPAKR
jgi:hypothetical protein